MQPTYQDLVRQNQDLVQRLEKAYAEIQILKADNAALKADNEALRAEIAELKDKLNTNSSNSSTPPSQDPFRTGKKRKATGRTQGAQRGHRGHPRNLVPLEQVQTQHDLRPRTCPNCQTGLVDAVVVKTEIRQVLELPEAPPEVTQYNIHTCRCGRCGKHVRADIPNEAQYGFGPRLMGLITSLSGEFRLSKRQVTALVGKLGIRICSGSVCNIHARASEILRQPFEEIKCHTLQQRHLNIDESSWKTLSEKRWLWIGHGADSVFFEITPSRSTQAFRNIFGLFQGGVTTDRYSVYNSHEGVRQLCWAHIDRDFEKIAAREGFDKWIGAQLLACKTTLFDLWHSFKGGQFTRDELVHKIETGPKDTLQVLLKAAVLHEDCQHKTKATCMNFLTSFDILWTFVYHDGVEPTNNRAERGLRHGVIWRKISHGSQSIVGERFVERVMTVAMTLKLLVKNSFDYFTRCFSEFIRGGQSPPVFTK